MTLVVQNALDLDCLIKIAALLITVKKSTAMRIAIFIFQLINLAGNVESLVRKQAELNFDILALFAFKRFIIIPAEQMMRTS